jgi:hypothetical protein
MRIPEMWLGRIAIAAVLLGGCQSTGPADPAPTARGGRHFGFHVTAAADNDYVKAFQTARGAGMDLLPLALSWNEVETPTGWNFATLDLIATFYASQGVPLYLNVTSPINTTVSTVPARYQSMTYDDPRLIAGFAGLLDSIKTHLGALPVAAMMLGNEIDATLGNNLAAWAQYQMLFEAAKARARQLWGPSLEVGAAITRDGLEIAGAQAAIDRLVAASDIASVTYYPLNPDLTVRPPSTAASDFDRVVQRLGSKPICFQEVGYPTSNLLNSSDEKQRQFVVEVFRAWDRYATQVRFVGWLWLTDLSQQQTDDLVRYYSLSGSSFATQFGEFLRTLGLRTYSGQAKPGFTEVASQLKARGW